MSYNVSQTSFFNVTAVIVLCHLVFPESQGVPSTLSQKDKVSRPVLPAPPPRSQQLPQLVGVLHSIRVCRCFSHCRGWADAAAFEVPGLRSESSTGSPPIRTGRGALICIHTTSRELGVVLDVSPPLRVGNSGTSVHRVVDCRICPALTEHLTDARPRHRTWKCRAE